MKEPKRYRLPIGTLMLGGGSALVAAAKGVPWLVGPMLAFLAVMIFGGFMMIVSWLIDRFDT